jgi:hypothetical protein
MLAEAVAPRDEINFRDVRDPSAFVHATIIRWQRPTSTRGAIVLSDDEYEELHAEGMAIMCRLARDYKPHMAGYEHAGRFSGYAAMYLPRKLGDAWHRMHEEHQLVTQPDGSRAWDYRDKPVSIEAMTAEDPDRHDLLAAKADETDLRSRVGRALDERWARKREIILDVADALGQGATGQDAAAMLGLTSTQVGEAVTEIMLVADRLRSEDA